MTNATCPTGTVGSQATDASLWKESTDRRTYLRFNPSLLFSFFWLASCLRASTCVMRSHVNAEAFATALPALLRSEQLLGEASEGTTTLLENCIAAAGGCIATKRLSVCGVKADCGMSQPIALPGGACAFVRASRSHRRNSAWQNQLNINFLTEFVACRHAHGCCSLSTANNDGCCLC